MNKVIQGNCLDVMKAMDDNSVDSIVTDPPAGIAFMNKDWDKDKGGRSEWIAWMETVAAECIRVIKPGGHALVWAIPRTSHWTGMAWENAGWTPREKIYHIFGSGFPKSQNIGKAIDKCGASEGMAIRMEISRLIKASGISNTELAKICNVTSTLVGYWRGMERNIQKPEAEKLKAILNNLIPSEAERMVVGQGCDYGHQKEKDIDHSFGFKEEYNITAPATSEAQKWEGWGSALKPAHEPIVLARKPLSEKTIAANVLKWGTGGININKCRISTNPEVDDPRLGGKGDWSSDKMAKNVYEGGYEGKRVGSSAQGRFPANIILDGSEEVKALFPETGPSKSGGMGGADPGLWVGKKQNDRGGHDDNGGSASRYFKSCPADEADYACLYYCPKASKAERQIGLDDSEESTVDDGRQKAIDNPFQRGKTPRKNVHPTIKPLSLMAYLVRLVTPPGGTVLDPFAGSGTTIMAAVQEGFNGIGIEKEQEYVEIAKCRVGSASKASS